MSFLSPIMLWGAVAAAVPIALHFFFRSRYRTVLWAAMRFLLTSIEQTSRRLKFQEWLLLASRVLLLVLFAAALARPTTMTSQGGGDGSRGDAVDAIFIIDTSYSMAARDGELSRLERAKKAARALVDRLPAYSTVQVVTSSDRADLLPERGLKTPSNLDQARKLIPSIEVSHQATDFLPAVQKAMALLKEGQAPNKAVFLFSDMQGTGFQRQSDALQSALKQLGEQAAVYLVRCGTRPVKNVAVVGITPNVGVLRTGERAGFSVLVRNSGKEKLTDLTVTLHLDGRTDQEESRPLPELPPGETKAVALTAQLDRPGLTVLTATVKADDLEIDNRLDRVVHVYKHAQVLVVDGAPSPRRPEDAGSYHLMHSLLPIAEEQRGQFHLQPEVVTPDIAHPRHLEDADVVILNNVALDANARSPDALSPEFVSRLTEYVRAGHPLIIFAGKQVADSADAYNRILYEKHRLLPAKVKGTLDAPAKEQPLYLDPDTADGFLVPFRQKPLVRIGAARFNKALEVEDQAGPDFDPDVADAVQAQAPRVVFRFGPIKDEKRGRPAVLRKKLSAGEVVLVTMAADRSWGDWPATDGDSYFALIHITLQHLLPGRTDAHNRTIGENLVWNPPASDLGRIGYLRDPKGDRSRLGPLQVVDNRPTLTATTTPRAGVYWLLTVSEAGLPKEWEGKSASAGVPFAVSLQRDEEDPHRLRESENLESLTDAQLDKTFGFPVVHWNAEQTASLTRSEQFTKDWTFWFLVGVMVLVLGEAVLAWACGQAW